MNALKFQELAVVVVVVCVCVCVFFFVCFVCVFVTDSLVNYDILFILQI